MEIIKISQQETNWKELNPVLDYYKENIQGGIDDKLKVLKKLKEFKKNWLISVLYRKLFNELKPGVIEWFSKFPSFFNSQCPEGFKHDPEVLQAIKPAVIKHFSEYPNYFNLHCPEEFKHDPEVLQAIKPAVIQFYSKNPNYFNSTCPEELKHNPEVLQAIKPGVIQFYSKHPDNFNYECPEELKHDPEVLQAILNKLNKSKTAKTWYNIYSNGATI